MLPLKAIDMNNVLNKYQIKQENTIAMGNSIIDLGLIKEAGHKIAFCSNCALINHHANSLIHESNFSELLTFAK